MTSEKKRTSKSKKTPKTVKVEVVDPNEVQPQFDTGDNLNSTDREIPFNSSTELDSDLDSELDSEIGSSSDPGPAPGVYSGLKSALHLPESSGRELTTADPIQLYLSEIRKYPLLTKEKELELAKKYYDSKDPQVAQQLVTANLRFVVKIAAEYSKFGARMIDLIQEGNMGLMHAVREFNPYKGVRLITYAVWWIRGYIQEYMMKQYSLVKIGTTQNQKKLFYRLQKEKRALEAMGNSPDLLQIGHKLGIPEDEVIEMAQRLSSRDLSLSSPRTGDEKDGPPILEMQRAGAESLDDQLAHEQELSLLREKIEILRPQLNEREIILLEERLLADEPLTLQEIGEKYGITREAVRQAEARLMDKIKKQFTEN